MKIAELRAELEAAGVEVPETESRISLVSGVKELREGTTPAPAAVAGKPALEDRLEAKAAKLKKKIEDEHKRLGGTLFANPVQGVPNLARTGVYLAFKLSAAGVRGGKKLAAAARTFLAEMNIDARHDKAAIRVARALLKEASREDGTIDPEKLESAAEHALADADAHEERSERPKTTINRATGVNRDEPKTVTAKQALSGAYKAAAREAGKAHRDSAVVGEARIRLLREQMKGQLRTVRLRDDIKARSRQAASEARLTAARDIANGARAEAVRILEENAPQSIKGKYLAAVRDATSLGKVASIISRLHRDLVIWEARGLRKVAARLATAKNIKTIDPDNRSDAVRAKAEIVQAIKVLGSAKARAGVSTDELAISRDTLRAAINTIKGILHEQKTRDNVRIRGELVNAIEFRERIAERLTALPSLEAEPDEAPDVGAIRKFARQRTNWHVMSQEMDGWQKSGPSQDLYNEVLEGGEEALALHHAFEDDVQKLVQRHGWPSVGHWLADLSGTLGTARQKRIGVDFGPFKELTLGQAAYVVAAMGDPEHRLRMAVGQPFQWRMNPTGRKFKITPDMLDAIVQAIPEKVRATVEGGKELYNQHFGEKSSGVNKRTKGYYLDLRPGYWGVKLNRQYSEGRGTPFHWKGQIIRAQEESGFMQEIKGPSKIPILLGDFGTDLMLRARSAATVIAKAERIKLVTRTLLHPDMQTLIVEKFGISTLKRLERRMSLWSGGDMYREANESAVRSLLSFWKRGRTQMWLPSLARNAIAGVPRLGHKLPFAGLAAAQSRVWSHPIKTLRELRGLSPILRERWSSGGYGEFITDSFGTTGDATSPIGGSSLKLGASATMAQVIEAARAVKDLNRAEAYRAIGQFSKPWRAVLDSITFGNIFDAMSAMVAYEYHKANLPEGMRGKEGRKWAAKQATRDFEETANTGRTEYANDIQLDSRDSLLVANLVPFTGDTAKLQSMIAQAHHGTKTQKAKTAISIATGIMLSAAIGAAWKGLLGDDDEEMLDAAITRVKQEAVSLLPGGSILSNLFARGPRGTPEMQVPLVELINGGLMIAKELEDAVVRIGDVPKRGKMTSEEKLLRAGWRAVDLLGSASGLPTHYISAARRAYRNWVLGE